eukprot:IDg20996t1
MECNDCARRMRRGGPAVVSLSVDGMILSYRKQAIYRRCGARSQQLYEVMLPACALWPNTAGLSGRDGTIQHTSFRTAVDQHSPTTSVGMLSIWVFTARTLRTAQHKCNL